MSTHRHFLWLVLFSLTLPSDASVVRHHVSDNDLSVLRSAVLLRERGGVGVALVACPPVFLLTRNHWWASHQCHPAESAVASQARLRAHFARVESILREQTEASLAIAVERLRAARGETWSEIDQQRWTTVLRENRATQVERLREYARRGLFPLNEHFPHALIPIFVDRHDTACAVGHLMRQSGWNEAVAQISRDDNHVYVPDAHDGPLVQWVLQSGLTQEEAALIQPAYGLYNRCWRGVSDFNDQDLSDWDFSGQNLEGELLCRSNLTGADLSGANLAGAGLGWANLTDADLSGANLERADLIGATLTSANLSGANLMLADLAVSRLADANFSGSVVARTTFGRNATSRGFTNEQLYSTASYQAKDLRGIGLADNDLSGWDFSGQNLAGANLYQSRLTDVDFSGAVVTGANLSYTTSSGFTKEQLYSTASYQTKNLQGIELSGNDLSGWDFRNQNLSSANLDGLRLNHTDLRGANLKNVRLWDTSLSSANFDSDTIYNQWTTFPQGFDPARFGLTKTQSPPGDFDGNDVLDAVDIDWLTRRIRETNYSDLVWRLPMVAFELNGDDNVSWDDHEYWVKGLKQTWYGDANLDGLFQSDDLVMVMAAGKYVDGLLGNSTWATGDWNGDGEFTSADLILAMSDGGYEVGPSVTVTAVPEPCSMLLLGLGGLWLVMGRGRRGGGGWEAEPRIQCVPRQNLGTSKRTWFGDANLDGVFQSDDLVTVLAAGEYEDDILGNSGWATGDWDADGDFASSDLVAALADGGYEAGPRTAVAAVPEPTSHLLVIFMFIGWLGAHRSRVLPRLLIQGGIRWT